MKKYNCLEEYLNFISGTKNLSINTILAYRSDILDFLNYLNYKKLDSELIIEYFIYLKDIKKLKISSIKRKSILIKKYITYLIEKKILKTNVLNNLNIKFKKEYTLPRILKISEIKKLLLVLYNQKNINNTYFKSKLITRDIAIIELLISTGIRIGELSLIKINDVDLNSKTILIHGKGKKQRSIYLSNKESITAIKNLLSYLDKADKQSYLFLNRYSNKLSIHAIERIYQKYAALAGISNTTCHFLRHTFATNMLLLGANIKSLQEILGHESISTTEIYINIANKEKIQTMKKYNYRNKINI